MPPAFLTDCRFLVSANSFHFASFIELPWRTIGILLLAKIVLRSFSHFILTGFWSNENHGNSTRPMGLQRPDPTRRRRSQHSTNCHLVTLGMIPRENPWDHFRMPNFHTSQGTTPPRFHAYRRVPTGSHSSYLQGGSWNWNYLYTTYSFHSLNCHN